MQSSSLQVYEPSPSHSLSHTQEWLESSVWHLWLHVWTCDLKPTYWLPDILTIWTDLFSLWLCSDMLALCHDLQGHFKGREPSLMSKIFLPSSGISKVGKKDQQNQTVKCIMTLWLMCCGFIQTSSVPNHLKVYSKHQVLLPLSKCLLVPWNISYTKETSTPGSWCCFMKASWLILFNQEASLVLFTITSNCYRVIHATILLKMRPHFQPL